MKDYVLLNAAEVALIHKMEKNLLIFYIHLAQEDMVENGITFRL